MHLPALLAPFLLAPFLLPLLPLTFARPCTHLNPAALTLIKDYEGFIAAPTDDGGPQTVGYGHACSTPSCTDVAYAFPLSKRAATALLKASIPETTSCLAAALAPAANLELSDNQWGALASWAFGEGCEAVTTSTLVKRLVAGEDPAIVVGAELPRWNSRGGEGGAEEMPGLKRRRAAELALFRTPSTGRAFPTCQL